MLRVKQGLLISFCVVLAVFGVLSFSFAHQDSAEFASLATGWQEGYTLILMSNTDISSANQARDYVMSRGGRIAILSPPHIMLGWVPPQLSADLIGEYGIELVTQTPIDLNNLKYRDDETLAMATFFNSVASGPLARSLAQGIAASAAVRGAPLINDALEQPIMNNNAYSENLRRMGMASPSAPSPGNSDTMTGLVAVRLFFVESDGSIDPGVYTWTSNPTDLQNTYIRVMSSLTWWANQATSHGETLSFTVSQLSTQQGYEPILHPSTDDGLWINEVMADLGFSSGNKIERVRAFNTWLKEWAGADWAYSVFIGYNPSPAPDRFTNGYFAYAYLGGPYAQLLFRNDGWGEENFGLVLLHETGHIFWACDEYYQAGYGGCTSCGSCAYNGPRPTILNGNCEYCNPNAAPCMMRDNSYTLCSFTTAQIGWDVSIETPIPVSGWPPYGQAFGNISAAGEADWFYFDVPSGAGGTWNLWTGLGSLSDSMLEVWNSTKTTMLASNDNCIISGCTLDHTSLHSRIDYTLVENTRYYLRVRGYSSSTGSYMLKVQGPGGQVETPTFSPAPGAYRESVSVSVSCATSGATIRYTTDGSDPTSSSQVHSSPLTLITTTTLKARGFKSGMTDSAVASGTYTIETGDAPIPVSGIPPSGQARGSILVSGEQDWFYFDVPSGAGGIWTLWTELETLGDSILELSNSTKTTMLASNDNCTISGCTLDHSPTHSRIDYTLSAGTRYCLKVRGYSMSSGIYTVKVKGPGTMIAVTSPNGGENWAAGSTQMVQWTYTGNPGSYVKIELLKGGVLNRTIISSCSIGTAGSGSYPWAIPSIQAGGSDYQVRVTSITNSAYTDMSNEYFTITEPIPLSITVRSPDGGENWAAGSTQTVRWTYTGNPGSNVKIELLKGGVLKRTISSSRSIGTAGSGSYSWPILSTLSGGSDYQVRVTSATNSAYTDTSNEYFTITEPIPSSITVSSPNGGENWAAGTTQTIQWTYTGNPGNYVKIELLKGGVLNRTIIGSPSIGTAGSGSYSWAIPSTQVGGSDYQVRVTSTTNSAYTDTSNSNFTLTGLPLPSVTVSSPDGGENWAAGTTQTVQWTYTGNPGNYVKIELLKGGVSNLTISSSRPIGTAGSGSYSWAIPSIQAGGSDYQVRVTSTTNSAYTGASDGNFTITGPSITLSSPNGGENWAAGSTQTISWSYMGSPGSTVKIELLKGGKLNLTISSSRSIGTAGSGSYSWPIRSTQVGGSDYQVRVTSTTNSTYTDTSNGFIMITP